jgi:hypothetical protein
MKRTTVREEKIASKIAEIISPVDVNLDDVGFYLAQMKPPIHYNRLLIVTESAIAEQERINERTSRNYL